MFDLKSSIKFDTDISSIFHGPAAGRVAPPPSATYVTDEVVKRGCIVTMFEDRERGREMQFARAEEIVFRITARRNRLLGQWAAEQMGLTPEETDAYAKAVVQADFEESGDEDVVRKLFGDLTAAGVDTDDATVRTALAAKAIEARRQLMQAD